MDNDAFADPAIAAEMREVVGVRYVCMEDGCTWRGYRLEDRPACGSSRVLDRWQAFAEECAA